MYKIIKVRKLKVKKVKMNVIKIFKKITLLNRKKKSLNKVILISFKVTNQPLLPAKLTPILKHL